MRAFRIGLSAVLAIYAVALGMAADGWSPLDHVNLPVHETGHLIFAPFGDTMMVLGGTLLQLLVPSVFAVSFLRRRDVYAASVCVWWVGQNGINISRYMADAIPMELPLVGGGEHDWNALFSHWQVLGSSLQYAAAVEAIGVSVMFVGAGWGLLVALRAPARVDAVGEASP